VKGVRLVVFDLDGTLVDSSEDIAAAVNRALRAFDSPVLDVAQVRSFVGEGARRLIEKSLVSLESSLRVEEVLPVFLDSYRASLLERTHLYPGTRDALIALAPRRLAVLTNKPGDMSRAILSGLGVAHHFDWIWGAGDVPARKPDPAGLLRLIQAAGVSAPETAFVGDSAVDVRTARAAGAYAIGVSYGFDPEAFVDDGPDAQVQDPREIAGLLS
jgi:phosphoglycolate phosphatase